MREGVGVRVRVRESERESERERKNKGGRSSLSHYNCHILRKYGGERLSSCCRVGTCYVEREAGNCWRLQHTLLVAIPHGS